MYAEAFKHYENRVSVSLNSIVLLCTPPVLRGAILEAAKLDGRWNMYERLFSETPLDINQLKTFMYLIYP